MIRISSKPVIKVSVGITNVKILSILGKSTKPLSSREIEKRVVAGRILRDRQVYRMLENELCIRKFQHKFFLFDWDDLLMSIYEEKIVRRKINLIRIFEQIKKIDISFDFDSTEFEISEDQNTILIRGGANLIKIQKDLDFYDRATLTIFKNRKASRPVVPLTLKKVNKKTFVYYEGIMSNPTQSGSSYLKVTLKNKLQKEFDRLNSIDLNQLYDAHNFGFNDEQGSKISKSEFENLRINRLINLSERKNWRYSLNSRGLMLYLLSMMKEEMKLGRERNVEISKILENLSDSFKEDFPFLTHYSNIKNLCEQLPEQKKSKYSYFQVKCLKQIAIELQNQIDTIDKKELDYYIIKRYSEESTRFFISPTLASAPLTGFIRVIPDPVRKYLVTNLIMMRDYLRTKLQESEYDIKKLSENA